MDSDTKRCTTPHTPASIPLADEYHFMPASGYSSPHTAYFYAFNTCVTLSMYAPVRAAQAACHYAFEQCREFEQLFSRTIPTSDICQIHAKAPEWVPISAATYDVLKQSLTYCEASQGHFDITMGTVSKLWDFNTGHMPDSGSLQKAIHHVDFHALELCDCHDTFARLTDPAASLDIGGTAKGYIADSLRDMCIGHGIKHFLINLGGNVLAHGGKPNGDPFMVGIKDPQHPESVITKVPIMSGSVVTSGLYERSFMHDGIRYSHILSTQTGMPITTDVESVTVVALNSADCDGFSTTLCALGLQEGIRFALSRPEILLAIFIDTDNNVYATRDIARA